VLVASVFGATVKQMDDNPPWIEHPADEAISLAQIADTDPLNFSRGWIARATGTMQAYHEMLGKFPPLKEKIRIVLPDLQGPFDNLELVRGSAALMELATEAGAAARALESLTTAQIGLAKHFGQWSTEPAENHNHQQAVMLKGNILLRNDCSIMVSPQMYREHIAPHDERVMRELDGGAMHACGRVEHLVDEWLALPYLRSIDFGQSELNDLDVIYHKAAIKKTPLIRLAVCEAEILSGNAWRRFPTGVVLVHRARNFEAALQVCRSLRGKDGQ